MKSETELELRTEQLAAQLVELLGEDCLERDPAELEYYSSDVYSRGVTACLVIKPADRERLPAAVAAITGAGFAVLARGGGMSYTGGYTPQRADTVILDMSGLNQIVDVSATNMCITVEAGVTWQQIYQALDPLGLRLPFFGTFSGSRATVGGGLSNGALFMATARYGTAAEIALGLEVITANGDVIKTGQAGFHNGRPFYRTYGPDLTGLFIHDAGALGIKTLITLRVIQKPACYSYASFIFAQREQVVDALSDIARADLTEEAYVFDPETTRRSLDPSTLKQDVRRLLGVVKGQASLAKGLREGAKLVRDGRKFVADDVYSLHVVCAASTQAAVDRDQEQCRRLAEQYGGSEIANSIPKAARANPFEPLNGVLGAKGDRWAALNAKIAHADAQRVIAAAEEILDGYQERMAQHGVTISRLFIAISNHAFSYEPVLRWHDEWLPIHRRVPEPDFLRTFTEPKANVAARELVHEIRAAIVVLFAQEGAASNQIGKTYPYFQSLKPETAALIAGLKHQLDPQGLINPGALGLPEP